MVLNIVISEFLKKINIFGLKLWIVIGVCVGLVIIVIFFLLWLWLLLCCRLKKDKFLLY